MKRMFRVILLLAMLTFLVSWQAAATPLDLTGFTAYFEPFVKESGGVVDFTETYESTVLFFYNDAFLVANNAKTLSFDFDFTLGEFDQGDYFMFQVDSNPVLYDYVNVQGAHYDFDLTSYRGQTISLEWSLQWSEDAYAETTASLYNIDLLTENTAPIPEPSTLILLGAGLLGVVGLGRKRLHS